MRFFYPAFLLLWLWGNQLFAQPNNNDCVSATELTELSNWCSSSSQFTTDNATASTVASPTCFPTNQVANDVWFRFTAEATEINISVVGNTAISPGGTLEDPQIALYAGTCSSLTEIECISDAFNANAIQTFAGPLAVGVEYYIRVSARNSNRGTFQLCVNNFNQVPEPSGDCNPGVILCDKSPFTVEFLTGAGTNRNETGNSLCAQAGSCGFAEQSSSWYKWTCKDPGTLAFTLTPLNPADDLDFLVYELPNGINDCTAKTNIICMTSGENVGSPFAQWAACSGATGLSLSDPNQIEVCGCQAGDNNFASAINMERGKSYALVVSNFSNSGSGFSIEFGGTGTFLGPEAAFDSSPNTICVGESITFTDASTFSGELEAWNWTFGPGANVETANTQGPHTITYNTPGVKSIVLSVESDGGCIVTEIATILVECCEDHFTIDAAITDLECPDDPTGLIDLMATSNYPPYLFEWDNGAAMEDINSLASGVYIVTITDNAGCETIRRFVVDSPPSFEIDTTIIMPTCNGGTDGGIVLNVIGGTPPYQYNWENTGFSTDNRFLDISQGDYAVTVMDANNCEVPMLIEVRELELILDPTVQAINPPTCTGNADGSIVVIINNGLPPYQYNWGDGRGFINENSLTQLSAGSYSVEVLDANLCSGSFAFNMEDFPPLELAFDQTDVSCFGENDGSIIVFPTGGAGAYRFQWSNGQQQETATQLVAGNYTVTVTDQNGCQTQGTITLTEPPELFIEVTDIVDVLCFNESTGSIAVIGSGGTGPYEYSLDEGPFQIETRFNDLPAGNYLLTVLDAMGCAAIVEATITQPEELIVDAGPDQTINLGFSTKIQAVSNEFPVDFVWRDTIGLSCFNCGGTTAMPVNTTTYTVVVTNENGCTATDEVTIQVIKNYPVYIPNAFSPNDDGLNDGFTAFAGPAADQIKVLKIFDRWGELVFDTQAIPHSQETLGWDGNFKGRPVNAGVFVYLIEMEFIDGEVILYKGDVTVMR